MMTPIILTLTCAAVFWGSVWYFRRWRMVSLGIQLCAMSVLLSALTLPVAPATPAEQRDKAAVVYLPFPLQSHIVRLRNYFGPRKVRIVAPDASRSLVASGFPEAEFTSIESCSLYGEGVTLRSVLEDLERRASMLDRAGTDPVVYLMTPTTDNVRGDKWRLEQLLVAHPWLRTRIAVIYPGAGSFQTWHGLPGVDITGPTGVAAGTPTYAAETHADAPIGSGATIRLEFRTAAGREFVDLNQPHSPLTAAAPGGYVVLGTFDRRIRLPAPSAGTSNSLVMTLLSAEGFPVSRSILVTSVNTPELGIIERKGAGPGDKSTMADLATGANIPHKVLSVDLDVASPQICNSNAKLLAKYGVVLVDVDLSELQAQNLSAALTRAGSDGHPAIPLFLGTSSRNAIPPGWQIFLGKLAQPPVQTRVIVIAYDWSGSMGAAIHGTSKSIHTFSAIMSVLKPLMVRNRGDMILLLGPGGQPVNLTPATGQTVDQKITEIETALKSIPLDGGSWELGPIVEQIDRIPGPISDIVVFGDNRDVHGPGSGDDNKLTDAALNAAKHLIVDRGCRMHVISIGGALDGSIEGGLVAKGVPADDAKIERLCFEQSSSGVDLQAKLRSVLFDRVLPRLRVVGEPDGWGALRAPGRDELARYLGYRAPPHSFDATKAAPKVELVSALLKFTSRDAVPNRDSVQMYAAHWSNNDLSPILFAGKYRTFEVVANGNVAPTDREDLIYWCPIDLLAETAYVQGSDSKARTGALADLLITVISAVATHGLNRPPVDWEVGADGWAYVTRRTGEPFNLDAGAGVHRPANGIFDNRDLRRPRFALPDLLRGETRTAEFGITDIDSAVGTQKMRLPITAPAPLPLQDPTDRDLFGKNASASATPPGLLPANSADWTWNATAFTLCFALTVLQVGLIFFRG